MIGELSEAELIEAAQKLAKEKDRGMYGHLYEAIADIRGILSGYGEGVHIPRKLVLPHLAKIKEWEKAFDLLMESGQIYEPHPGYIALTRAERSC